MIDEHHSGVDNLSETNKIFPISYLFYLFQASVVLEKGHPSTTDESLSKLSPLLLTVYSCKKDSAISCITSSI